MRSKYSFVRALTGNSLRRVLFTHVASKLAGSVSIRATWMQKTLCSGYAKKKGTDQPAHSRLCYSFIMSMTAIEISVLASLCS